MQDTGQDTRKHVEPAAAAAAAGVAAAAGAGAAGAEGPGGGGGRGRRHDVAGIGTRGQHQPVILTTHILNQASTPYLS